VLGDALDVLQSQLGDVAGDAAGDALADITPSAREAALRLCSRYLLHAKSGRASSTAALDPVMNFHCRNGAAVERLNWAGDPSVRGVRQSGGIMVNYAYNLDELAENAESYARGSVCASDVLMDLADGGAE
jgi:malonyl-CoA decarboxylase|tara:strand:+ start:94 stop:486 length:393 start_codon:yes stop_codon:yes gene_type:complete